MVKTTPAGAIQVRLPEGLRRQLEIAAEVRGVTLSDEIRTRLQSSLVLNLDWRTQKFVDAVGFVAAHVRNWHQNRRSFALLRVGIGELLTHVAPPSEPSDPAIEREAARIAGIAIGCTELGLGEEWGWDQTPEEARTRR